MADYRIDLGVGLNQSQLNQVKQVLESIENQKRDVIYNVDFSIKNASKLTEVSKEIEKIQTQLNSVGSGKNIKAAIPIDSKSIETTLNKVNESIKKIRNSLGTVDSKKGVQSLLTTVNKINTALDKVSKQFTDLNRNLTNLSSKDFSLNFDFGFGNSSKNPEQAIKELNMLKREVEEYEKYFRKFYSMGANEANVDPINRLIFQHNQRNRVYGLQLQEAMSKGSDAQKIAAYKQYINLIKETAAIGKISLEPVEFRLAESGEFIKVRNEASETQKQLQELFSGGINAENLHRTLSEIADDLRVIKESLAGVSSEADSPINQLTQSFNKLSESIERLVSNAALVKNVLGDGLVNTAGVDTSAINKIEKASDDSTAAVIQNEKKKQEAYKATADAVVYHAGVVSKLNKAETNGRFYGSNRGTGYFGTGHYFVDSATKHELDNDSYYSKLPYTSVDISQYGNLFKATTDEVAEGLHSFLGNLTRFTQGADDYSVSELFAQFKNVFGDTIMDIKEFGSKLDQLKTFMSNSSLDDRSDSVSTQFMKSLGYEGVDTRGTNYADTRYGTVIYDLKEESILQANITDELQKQGQMLEKINYARGQAFDKDADTRIQADLDAQAKKREIAEEFQNSFDTTNLNKIDAELANAKNNIKEIDEAIFDLQKSINNAEQEAKKFAKEMADFGIDVSDEEIKENARHIVESYGETIDELSRKREEWQSKASELEESYGKEQQLANEAYKQAQQTVEQRHLEAQQAQQTADAVTQGEERKQQAIKETANIIESTDNQGQEETQQSQETANAVVQAEEKKQRAIKETAKETSQLLEYFRKYNAIDKASAPEDSIYHNMDVDSVSLKRAEYHRNQIIKQLTSGNGIGKITSLGSIDDGEISQRNLEYFSAMNAELEKLGYTLGEIKANSDNSVLSADIIPIDENAVKDAEEMRNILFGVESQQEKVAQSASDVANTIVQAEERKQQAYRETADAAEQVSKIKIGNTELDALSLKDDIDEADKLAAAISKLNNTQKSIDKIEIGEIDISKGVQEIQTLEQQLESLSKEYNETVAEIKGMGGVSATQMQSFQNDIDNTNRKIEQLQSNLREKIQTAIGTDVAKDVARVHSEFDKLSDKSNELRQKLQALDDIQIELETEKERGDIQKLFNLYSEYLKILKDVNTQIDINKKAQKDATAQQKLTDDIGVFQSKIDSWLTKNSAAAKQFGSTMLELKARAEGCDRATLNHLEAEFKQVDRAAEAAGKKTKTLGDSLKAQFSKYSTYFGVAEMFMYAEQGLRSMFEQVKLIDSAMTELKKVTDETDASYNQFLSNAAAKAKEIGTTIDGLVSSTADFARLGYGFEDAQGLAEVANIYAVVGDEIEGVEGATESLISTMAAFKGEMGGLSNTDFAMSIIDKFNEIGNNFAISSGGIGEALERSASSLMAANNTIDESIALITAANTVVVLCHAA